MKTNPASDLDDNTLQALFTALAGRPKRTPVATDGGDIGYFLVDVVNMPEVVVDLDDSSLNPDLPIALGEAPNDVSGIDLRFR